MNNKLAEALAAAGHVPPAAVARDMMRSAIIEGQCREEESVLAFERRLPQTHDALVHLAYIGREAQRAAVVRFFNEVLPEMRGETESGRLTPNTDSRGGQSASDASDGVHAQRAAPAAPVTCAENTRGGHVDNDASDGVHAVRAAPGTCDPNLENTRGGQSATDASDGVHPTVAAPGTTAPPVPIILAAPAQQGRKFLSKTPPAPQRPQRLYVPSNGLRRAYSGYLKTVLINGVPLGECTAGTARTWMRTTRTNVRFVERLVKGLEDDMVIGQYHTQDEAAVEFARAEKEFEDVRAA